SPVTGGGLKYMKYWPDSTGRGIEVNTIEMDLCRLAALEKSMVVCYSGLSRPAKSILDAVAQGVESGEQQVVEALKGMSKRAEEIRVMLLSGQVEGIGRKLTEVWELHKRLHPDVTGEQLDRLYSMAMKAGATGGRVCGAGGGGTMLFFAAPGREYAVRKALRDEGARIFDCSIDTHGLLRW
ncbi:MAG: hypothetical protein R6V19_10970, partial [Armatimonadota bacterium]